MLRASLPRGTLGRVPLRRSSFKTIHWIVLSAAANAAADHSSPFHGRTQAVKLGAKRRVDHARADLDDQATQQGGIDLGEKARFLAQLGLERGLERVDFGVAEG